MNSKETGLQVQTEKFLLAFHFFMRSSRNILHDISEIINEKSLDGNHIDFYYL